MDWKNVIGILAVAGALAFGACEQSSSRPGTAERGGTTSAPASRSPSGDTTSRSGSSAADRGGAAGMASGSSDMSGIGGAGDAGMGRDAGMR